MTGAGIWTVQCQVLDRVQDALTSHRLSLWATGSVEVIEKVANHLSTLGQELARIERIVAPRPGDDGGSAGVYALRPVQTDAPLPLEYPPIAHGDPYIIDQLEGVAPLDAQMGVWPKRTTPPDLRDALFSPRETSDDSPVLSTFAVLDAARVPGLVDALERENLPYRCLFKGEAQRSLEDAAPYLAQLREDATFTRRLFTVSDAPAGLWDDRPAIYLRSVGTIDQLREHFRRFTRAPVESGAWFFLRFWEPQCFLQLALSRNARGMALHMLAPAARRGGAAAALTVIVPGPTTHIIRARDPLRDQSMKRNFVLDNADLAAIEVAATETFIDQMARWLKSGYPECFASFAQPRLRVAAAHVVRVGMGIGCTLKEDIAFLGHAMLALGGWFLSAGEPSRLIEIFTKTEGSRQTALNAEFGPIYGSTPVGQLTDNWPDVIDHLRAIPEGQFTSQEVRRFVERFLPGQDLRALSASIGDTETWQDLDQGQRGCYAILTLIYGFRFEADPLQDWSSQNPSEAISSAWSELIG